MEDVNGNGSNEKSKIRANGEDGGGKSGKRTHLYNDLNIHMSNGMIDH